MGPRGNPGPSTVQRSHNQLAPPGFRVVPRSAILGDTAVASFASKKVRVTFGCRRSSCQKDTKNLSMDLKTLQNFILHGYLASSFSSFACMTSNLYYLVGHTASWRS